MFIGLFSQKSPIISGSFAKNDLQLKASYGSSPPSTTQVTAPGLSEHYHLSVTNFLKLRCAGRQGGNCLQNKIKGTKPKMHERCYLSFTNSLTSCRAGKQGVIPYLKHKGTKSKIHKHYHLSITNSLLLK